LDNINAIQLIGGAHPYGIVFFFLIFFFWCYSIWGRGKEAYGIDFVVVYRQLIITCNSIIPIQKGISICAAALCLYYASFSRKTKVTPIYIHLIVSVLLLTIMHDNYKRIPLALTPKEASPFPPS
jgi:hypothetical protein